MMYTLSYQMYKCEHGVSADEQRAADGRAGAAAAAVRDLRAGLRHRFRWEPARRGAGRGAGSMRLLSSGR